MITEAMEMNEIVFMMIDIFEQEQDEHLEVKQRRYLAIEPIFLCHFLPYRSLI